MIYLASPYAHVDPAVMQDRFHRVCAVTAAIMLMEKTVPYSPIAHNHYLACNFNLPRGWDFWGKFDLEVLKRCDALWVLTLNGWKASKGVAAEIDFARANMIPVAYIDEESFVG